MEYFRNIYPHVSEVKQLINKNNKIIIFDTETTGLEDDAKIIQFSAVLYDIQPSVSGKINFIELESYDTFINPGAELDPIITELTGITNEQVQAALPEKDKFKEIQKFMEKADLWAAYNANFDLLKLKHMCLRLERPILQKDCIDVLVMARNVIHKADIKNHKLATVTEYLYPNYEAQYHNSLEDVRATGKCLSELYREYNYIQTPTFPEKKLTVTGLSYWKNSNNGSMRRLTIWSNTISGNKTGLFWSCKDGCFSCESKPIAKQLFRSVNLPDIERQILNKYGPKYNVTTMDDLSRVMEHEYNEKKKAEKQFNNNTQINKDVYNNVTENTETDKLLEKELIDDDIELI